MKKPTFILIILLVFINPKNINAQKSVRDSIKEFSIKLVNNALSHGKIKNIAVWDFTDMNKEVSVFGSYVSELFSIYAENVDSIELMDRQNLKSVLKEHKLKSEGFIDKNTIMELGKFFEVEAVAVGSVIMADKNFQVLVKIIGTNSGKTIAADEQYFQIDKNMAAILGIDFFESNTTSNNNANRGYNKPINSNEQYNNSSIVKKECETNKTGDYCFYNGTKQEIVLFFCNQYTQCEPLNFGAEYIILKPKESKCFYDLSDNGVYKFNAFSKPEHSRDDHEFRMYCTPSALLDQGNIKVEKCKSKTYTIK
jgi:TolB-like protein